MLVSNACGWGKMRVLRREKGKGEEMGRCGLEGREFWEEARRVLRCFLDYKNPNIPRSRLFLRAMTSLSLDVLDPSVDPREFFENYVAKRKPVILRGLPKDPAFKARNWVGILFFSISRHSMLSSEKWQTDMKEGAHDGEDDAPFVFEESPEC